MSKETRIRTRTQDGLVELLVLVSHPMETGQRVDKKTRQKMPAHFITEMSVQHNGKPVANISMGIGVSENPLISVRCSRRQTATRSRSPGSTTRDRAAAATP